MFSDISNFHRQDVQHDFKQNSVAKQLSEPLFHTITGFITEDVKN